MRYFICFVILIYVFNVCGQGEEKFVYFDHDSYKLDENAKNTLDEIILNDRIRSLQVIGFTDTTGGSDYNQVLSLKRAKNVYGYLVSRGIDSSLFDGVIGKGERLSGDKLNKNRVVEISFTLEPSEKSKGSENTEQVIHVKDEPIIESDESKGSTFDHRAVTRNGDLNQKTIETLEVGDILNLGGIEFQPGTHILTRRSNRSIKSLVEIMEKNPTLRIEIQGHICCNIDRDGIDKNTGKRNLSKIRAFEVFMELVKAGISKDRMTYKGYGPTRKLYKEVDNESRQRNRRVSIQILEK